MSGSIGAGQAINDELLKRLTKGEDAEDRYLAALQLIEMGRGEETIAELGRMLEAPIGECRTRAAIQLARIGPASMAVYRSLVRAAVNHEDDGLSLAAVETLNTIDPENLVGAPQIVRLLRRRVLRMWSCLLYTSPSPRDS